MILGKRLEHCAAAPCRPASRDRSQGRGPIGRGLKGVPRCEVCQGHHFCKVCPNVYAKMDPTFSAPAGEREGATCFYNDVRCPDVACGGRGHFARHHTQAESEAAAGSGVPKGPLLMSGEGVRAGCEGDPGWSTRANASVSSTGVRSEGYLVPSAARKPLRSKSRPPVRAADRGGSECEAAVAGPGCLGWWVPPG